MFSSENGKPHGSSTQPVADPRSASHRRRSRRRRLETLTPILHPPCAEAGKKKASASSPHPRYSHGTTNPSSATVSTSFPPATASYSSDTSGSSLATFRDALPDPPAIYPFSEIRIATNNLLSKRHSSSSWRCNVRDRDVVVFQRQLHTNADISAVAARLSALCRSHHSSVIRLLGVSLAGGHIYLVYEHVPGAALSDCLRHLRNPGYTPLASWLSRIQIAADIAQGLEYIHVQSCTTHNRIKSSAILVTEPLFHAKICHFGTADLAGEIGLRRIDGSKGYMAPEVLASGTISQKSDVFAFGVVVLELMSGEEPVKCWFDSESGGIQRASVVESAREVIGGEEGGVEGRIRRWVDRRLKDSFPVDVAEKLIRVALRCVESEPGRRPEMTWVAAKVSELLVLSEQWGERVRPQSEITVSLAPR